MSWSGIQRKKGSDVNLITRLLVDGFNEDCEQAVIVSNDADFVGAMRYVRDDLHLRVVLVSPDPRRSSPRELASCATYVRRLWKSHLRRSQFPETLEDVRGVIAKPLWMVTFVCDFGPSLIPVQCHHRICMISPVEAPEPPAWSRDLGSALFAISHCDTSQTHSVYRQQLRPTCNKRRTNTLRSRRIERQTCQNLILSISSRVILSPVRSYRRVVCEDS